MILITFADKDLNDRRGTVLASAELVESTPASLMLLASQLVITGVEFHRESKVYMYSGYSYHFEKIPFEQDTPSYSVVMENNMMKFVQV